MILGLKRLKEDDEKLEKFIKTHVFRLLKLDMLAVIGELERQEETALAIKVSSLRIFVFSLYLVALLLAWFHVGAFFFGDLLSTTIVYPVCVYPHCRGSREFCLDVQFYGSAHELFDEMPLQS